MEKEIFDTIFNDGKTVKLGECSGQHFLFEKEKLVIGFFFRHRSYPTQFISDDESRIMLSVRPSSNLSVDMPLRKIDISTLILVNTDNYDYAMTFLLNIDLDKRKVEVKIRDIPEMGECIITDAERNGIAVTY